MLKAFIK